MLIMPEKQAKLLVLLSAVGSNAYTFYLKSRAFINARTLVVWKVEAYRASQVKFSARRSGGRVDVWRNVRRRMCLPEIVSLSSPLEFAIRALLSLALFASFSLSNHFSLRNPHLIFVPNRCLVSRHQVTY
ncbi:unnamed protein product [Pylaiella littoralis]